MKPKTSQYPLIKLIGDPVENFYQLGLKDQVGHEDIYHHLQAPLKTSLRAIDKIVQETSKLIITQVIKRNHVTNNYLTAYAEGLDISVEDVALSLMIPEVFSCLSKWSPKFKIPTFGCSSFFMREDDTNSPTHTRILDFPLVGTFDQHERAIHYRLTDGPQIMSFGCAGMPFPSFTSMTEDGTTFAIHQKFSSQFITDGTPIFEMVYALLNTRPTCAQDVISFMKKSTSMTLWSFYMSFKNGEVLECDICGNQLQYNVFHLDEKNKYYYFNNQVIDKNFDQSLILPYGITAYNQMREISANKKILKLKKLKSRTCLTILKKIATPLAQANDKIKDWNLDCLTPSSLQVVTMAPSRQECFNIMGMAPKVYQNQIAHFDQVWDRVSLKTINTKGQIKHQQYQLGLRELILAQSEFDKGDRHQCFHHIQLSITYLKNYPEENIAKFYFLILQFINENHKKLLSSIFVQFQALEGQLPTYLNDHCLLFINRLERILNYDQKVDYTAKITHQQLKATFEREQKIPIIILHKILKISIKIQIGVLDIIYLHAHH